MKDNPEVNRRSFLQVVGAGTAGVALGASTPAVAELQNVQVGSVLKGVKLDLRQRLPEEKLQAWEALGYGMFIHFGMSTFDLDEYSNGKSPATTYAPTNLDVDQWVSVARDAGMKYAILTAKHVAGHCLWPSKYTDYTVANSADRTDVVEKFVKACGEKGVLPGFYYCSWDNHNRFGSVTWSDKQKLSFTTSVYQTFQTNQVTELLTQYGPIAEMWIDIPGVLGRGYRTYLYNRMAELQPDTVIMMNSGVSTQETYDIEYAWPSDIIALERNLPTEKGYNKVREIEGKKYYMPGEVCDTIGKHWFWVDGDTPRDDKELANLFNGCMSNGVNFLLDVPPDKTGRIPDFHVQALNRLRKNVGL